MTYADALDNESGLLTGLGVLTVLPLLLVVMWNLEPASLSGGGTVLAASGVTGVVVLTVAMVLLLAVTLVAVHNLEW